MAPRRALIISILVVLIARIIFLEVQCGFQKSLINYLARTWYSEKVRTIELLRELKFNWESAHEKKTDES